MEGAAHTRQSFLAWLINPHLPRPLSPFAEDTSTLESVLHTTRRISHLLQETDSFSSVEATIERSRDLLSKAEDVDVVFKTREKGRYFVKTSTEMGNGEGNAVSNLFRFFPSRPQYICRASLHAPAMPLEALKLLKPTSLLARKRDVHTTLPSPYHLHPHLKPLVYSLSSAWTEITRAIQVQPKAFGDSRLPLG